MLERLLAMYDESGSAVNDLAEASSDGGSKCKLHLRFGNTSEHQDLPGNGCTFPLAHQITVMRH